MYRASKYRYNTMITRTESMSTVGSSGDPINVPKNISVEVEKNTNEIKIVSWNLWCVPLSSPRTLSNPDRCGSFVRQFAEKNQWDDFNGIQFVAAQELWAWKVGLFPSVILRFAALFEYIPFIGRVFSVMFQLVSILVGIIPILKCLPFRYCPKKRFASYLKEWVPYALYDSYIPVHKGADSGLLLLTNTKPNLWGFESFIKATYDDALTNKGFLYAYFEFDKSEKDANKNLLLINTNLQIAAFGIS